MFIVLFSITEVNVKSVNTGFFNFVSAISVALHYTGLTVVKNGLSLLVASDVKLLTHTEMKIHTNM
jgi:hypothetical protein